MSIKASFHCDVGSLSLLLYPRLLVLLVLFVHDHEM